MRGSVIPWTAAISLEHDNLIHNKGRKAENIWFLIQVFSDKAFGACGSPLLIAKSCFLTKIRIEVST